MLRYLRSFPITTPITTYLICVLSSPVAASDQSATDEIVGTIRAEDGPPVPFAAALMHAVDTGAIALEDGSYRIEVPLGTQAVTVPRPGTESEHTACVVAQVSRSQRFDVMMERVVPTEMPLVEISNRKVDEQLIVVTRCEDFMVRGWCRSYEVKTIVDGMPVSNALARPSNSVTAGGVLTNHAPARARGYDTVAAPLTLEIASANPTRGPVRLHAVVPRPTFVRLEVFDVAGRRVAILAEGPRDAGEERVTWDGRAAAGVYFVRLQTGDERVTQKITVVR